MYNKLYFLKYAELKKKNLIYEMTKDRKKT